MCDSGDPLDPGLSDMPAMHCNLFVATYFFLFLYTTLHVFHSFYLDFYYIYLSIIYKCLESSVKQCKSQIFSEQQVFSQGRIDLQNTV